jgi:hypothetical protein
VAAVFRIKQVFELRSRAMLMIVGDVVSGAIRVGDRATGLGREVSVAGVEMLTRADRTCDVALGVRYSDDEDLARLKGSAATGAELAISSAVPT